MQHALLIVTAGVTIIVEQLTLSKGNSNDTQAWYLSRGSGSPPVKIF